MSSRQTDQAAADTADLERFGYKQELKRELGTFSSFAVAFSYISPSTGIFTLFFLGMAALGGFLWWTWPVVALGQLVVALNFAELSSHFPVAGSVYQWTKYLAGRTYAWFTGWFYLIAGILTVASVCATLPLALLPALNNMFGWSLNTNLGSADQKLVALITLVIITVLNIYGVKLVAIVNNTGVFFEILGMVVFAVILAVAHNNQGVGAITKSGGASITPAFFLVGMFMSLYVIYGFDTASTLAEETRNPRQEAPKAVLASVIGAFFIGAIFLWGVLIAVPNMKDAVTGFLGPQAIIESVLSKSLSTIYLLVVSAAIFVCCMSILTSTIRLCFGMSRDDQLPASKTMARVSPRLHTPIWSCVVIGLLSAVPFIQFAGASTIAVAATASIYLSYLLGNLAVMRARTKGWPKTTAPFSLGKWGKVVNVVAIVWGAAMMLNFLWPASTTGANSLRIFSNPSPNQTDYFGTGPLVHFGGFLNNISLIEQVFVIVFIVGAIYYYAVQRKKPWVEVVPPEDEDLSGIAPATGPASTLFRMKIVTTPAAAAFIEERGGKVWVWLDPRRGLVGSYVWLEAHCEPPGSSRRSNFTRSSKRPHTFKVEEGAGIQVHYAFARMKPPEELHFDVKGVRNKTKRLEAYWNGSIFVGEDVDLPGTWESPSERKPR